MKIGMILDKAFPPDPRVENEAISLFEKGFEVYLFCLRYDVDQPDAEIHNSIQIRRYLSSTFEYKLSALAYSFPLYTYLMQKKIRNFLISNEIDVIHIHDIPIAAAVFKANKKLKLPVVLDLHENRPEIMKHYSYLKKFPANYLISPEKWKRKEEEFIKKADAIVVVTEEAKLEIVKRVGLPIEKMVVVPNTVRKAFYTDYELDKSLISRFEGYFVILYIGDTGLRRGILTAIEALPRLINIIPTIKLVIVGSSSDINKLKEKAAELDLMSFIDFEGWKDESLFQSYITASTTCISPLERNKHHDTTYANKLFQYMSFGKPLVVSNATAQKNLVERTNCGLVHDEKISRDFADKILELYNNKKMAGQLGENGKRYVTDEFSMEKVSKPLVEFYKELSN